MWHGKWRLWNLVILGCTIVCCWSPVAWCVDEHEYRGPEYYQSRGQTEDFVPEAKRYFETHADYENAPRVAFDLYMAAVVRGDSPLTEWAMARLVFDYPESLQARFLLTTIPQPANYGKFLTGQFNGAANVPGSRFLRKFAGAIDLGVQRFGPQFISGDDLLICCTFASRELGLLRLVALCDQNSRRATGDLRQIVQTLLVEELDSTERVVNLQKYADRPVVRTCQRQMLAALGADAREATAVRRVIAENLLREQKFGEALSLVDRLAQETGEPQVLFWKGWCLASLGKDENSAEAFETLLQKHPESEWRRPAEKLLQSAARSDAIVEAHADALYRVISKLKSEPLEAMELSARYLPEKKTPIDVYVWQDSFRQELEVQCRKSSRPLFAYLSSPASTRVYLAGESQIHHYEQPGGMLATQFGVASLANGDFQWNVHWQLVGRGADGAGLYRWFDSPAMSTEAGLRALLIWFKSRGAFPEAISADGELREFRWLDPVPERPEMKLYSLKIDNDDRLKAATIDRLKIDVFRHGPTGSFSRIPSNWPRLETVREPKIDGAMMMRVMTAVFGLFADVAEPQEVAEPESDSRIRR